ncbi:MAG: SsrA-binding protein SmpB [Bacilli bacterium]|nr:SsrA-binding protein SmpB [Bacilli bacterium]
MEIINRAARHNYFIEETYECGIVLMGTEIKSIRAGKCNLKDSYGIIKNNEVFLLNMFISPYKEASIYNVSETRSRKLLLHKKEIKKIKELVEQKGLTLVPLKMYFKGSNIKIELGLCKGKKNYDKRESIKQRDEKREMAKIQKNRY